MQTLWIALRAVLYVTAFIWFFGWLALRVRPFDERLGFSLPGWVRTPGLFLMVAGGILLLVCAGVFIVHGRGTPAVFDPPRRFVAVGPYKFVRNPMYIGGLGLLAGFGIWAQSISVLLLSLTLFLAIHLFVVFYEEPTLERQFGESYLDYKKSLNRWIPKFASTCCKPAT